MLLASIYPSFRHTLGPCLENGIFSRLDGRSDTCTCFDATFTRLEAPFACMFVARIDNAASTIARIPPSLVSMLRRLR
jgi:hypothetical protein